MGMDQRAFYVEKWDKWRHRKPLGYWRKNGWLDDWMTNLRRDRGEDDFFGWMELSKEDIEKLHLEIVAGQLALRKSSEKEYYDSGFMEKDFKFVEDALEHLANGSRIFYEADS